MPPATPETATAPFSRRTLLRSGLASGALLALGGTGLALFPTARRTPPSDTLRVLTDDEHAILAAVARRTCAPPSAVSPGADAIDVALLADRLLERASEEQVADLKTVIHLFENGLVGALFFERVRPFTQLDDAAQDAVLTAWRDSRIGLRRAVFRALTGLTALLYYGDPRVWPSVGYPGPPDPRALRAAYAENLVDLAALAEPGADQ